MLTAKRALIVERDFLIALDLQRILERGGLQEAIFARSTDEARKLRPLWGQLDLAIIEVTHTENAGIELAAELQSAGIAIILSVPDLSFPISVSALAGSVQVVKPFGETELLRACGFALGKRGRGDLG